MYVARAVQESRRPRNRSRRGHGSAFRHRNVDEQMPTPESLAGPVRLPSGYNVNAGQVALTSDAFGAYSVEVEELGRIELSVGGSRGYLMMDGAPSAFPIGSTLKDGVFHWQVPVGFLGKYELLFEQPDGTQIPVHVKVVPKRYSPE